jgi:putative methionine-R-sulfoxide reductase with GAF domain
MLKKIFIAVYTIFSLLSIYVFSVMAQALSQTGSKFYVDFWLIKIENPIAMLSFIIVNIIVGGFYIFFDENEVQSVKVFQETELESTQRHSDNITELIANQFQEKFESVINEVKKELIVTKDNALKTEKILWLLCKELKLSQGLIYWENIEKRNYELKSSYAYFGSTELINIIEEGVGLNGQVIRNKEFVLIKDVPQGYMKIVSGLGEISPNYLIMIPVINNTKVVALVEFAGLGNVSREEVQTIVKITESAFLLVV